MRIALITALMLSALFSYGQFKTFKPVTWSPKLTIVLPSGRQVDADSLYTALEKAYNQDKVDHVSLWQWKEWDAIWGLFRAIDILQTRIEVLEKRPFFETDSTKRTIAPTTYTSSGRMVDALDSLVKLLPKTNCKP
jgi:hypothetical protein